jgi:hypothetical protein
LTSRRGATANLVTLAVKVDAATAVAVQDLARSFEMGVSELLRGWCECVRDRHAYTFGAVDESDRWGGWLLLEDPEVYPLVPANGSNP